MPPTLPHGASFEELLTTDEAARFLKLSRSTLERYRVSGWPEIPFIKIGGKRGRVLYRLSDLLAFIEASQRTSTSDRGGRDGDA